MDGYLAAAEEAASSPPQMFHLNANRPNWGSRNFTPKSRVEGGAGPLCNTNAKDGVGVGGICQVCLSVSRGIKESGGIDGAGGARSEELQKTSLMTRARKLCGDYL